jgi:2-polyprenyl-3-methyl-5-hydroxy-6-metoxy-1,4-benzoquinol methylase
MNTCQSNKDCGEKKTLLFEKNGYLIMDCKKCSRRFTDIHDRKTHLSDVYSDEYFFEGKDGYPDYLDKKDILFKQGISYAKIIEKYTKPGKVLDVGCAAGFIMKGFECRGWEALGIEPNSTMADYGKNELHLNIQVGSLETFDTQNKFDLIIMIQVLGHLYEIDKAMENISQLSKQHGLILVESWNMNSLVARIRGKNWHVYCPPSVLNWFSNKSLVKLFKEYGFEKISSGFPLKRIKLNNVLSLLEFHFPKIFSNNKTLGFLSTLLGKLIIYYPPVDVKWYLFRKV